MSELEAQRITSKGLGIGTLEWSLDGCEGVLLVHVARIIKVN